MNRIDQRLPRTGFAPIAGTVREIAALAARGEQLGYESVWIAEVAGYDAVTLLTAIAAATSTLRIGTGIAGIYLRDPLLMAMSANAVNEYSQGRLLLGLGTSTPVIVERWHGMPWGKPLEHMREYTSLVRRLMSGERVKSSGLYNLSSAQLGVPAGGMVPIYFGALNPAMLALAGEVADGVILNFPTLSYTRRAVAAVNQATLRAGRPARSTSPPSCAPRPRTTLMPCCPAAAGSCWAISWRPSTGASSARTATATFATRSTGSGNGAIVRRRWRRSRWNSSTAA